MTKLEQKSRVIDQSFKLLYTWGEEVKQETWQSVKSPDNTIEIANSFFKVEMPDTMKELALMTKADIPWAEDHFQERIGGLPLNPGVQWENWPHYKKEVNDPLFKSNGKFSHTYMERYWPEEVFGRYEVGNYRDIIERAIVDQTSRQLYLSVWWPEDQSNVESRRLPCTLGYFFLIRQNKVHLTYFIRSCDILRHFRNDVYLSIRLAQDFREKVNPNLSMGTFSMWIGSLHCFKSEKEILKRHFREVLG